MNFGRRHDARCPTCGIGYVTDGFMARLTLWFLGRFG